MAHKKVTVETVKEKAAGDLGLTAKMISLLLLIVAIVTIISAEMTDAGRTYTVAIAFSAMLILNISAWFAGRYLKYFEKKACLSWYSWDESRLQFFEEEKTRIHDGFVLLSQIALQELFSQEPENREKIKSEVIEMVKKQLANFEQEKENLSRIMKEDEIDLVPMLQMKSSWDELSEKITEWLLDFLITLEEEEKNGSLVRERLSAVIREQHIPLLEERLAYYDPLIASCKKAMLDLAVILKERHGHVI